MGKRILLADDSVTIHKVVELTFLDEDYSVDAVNNGDEAIDRLGGEPPDLVIADVHMPPGPSGYEVCDRVREIHPGVPVLLLAGAFEAFDEERAARADAYLKKPFDSQRLLQTVQELLAGSGEAAEAAPAEPSPAAAPGSAAAAAASGAEGRSEAAAVEDEGRAETAPSQPAGATEPAPDSADGRDAPAELADGRDAAPDPADGRDAAPASGSALSGADIDAIARRVVELLGDDVVREVAWEVVPDLAEVVVKDRLRELEEPTE